ncbi:MAG: hypothetical protein F6K65_06125 [Moorea sp. SIO3C2]|nr:hypothetical protein [Moorena sp. SIO3C2]
MPRQIPEIRRASARVLVAVSVLLLGLGALAPNGSAGNVGCGTISFSFDGTRLLNDGISDSAGPFGIDLPGGTYDVMMRSADHHSEQDDQTGQEAERWWFSLDSGYRSAPTDDLPDDRDANATTLLAQSVPESRSISVHHFREGGVNSINPVCVGFTPSPGERPDPQDPGDPADDPERAPGGPDGGGPDDDQSTSVVLTSGVPT